MLTISLLAKLNLQPNYIYETIVTTYDTEDRLPNAAPMGIIFLDDQNVIISPYISTQTFKNIEKNRSAVINFSHDLELFFESVFNEKKPKLPPNYYISATKVEAPALKSSIIRLEICVREIQIDGERSKIMGEIVRWDYSAIPFHPLNRAYNLVLESIIHATRIIIFQNDAKKVKFLKDLINHYTKIVKKTAPTGTFIDLMQRIQHIIEKS